MLRWNVPCLSMAEVKSKIENQASICVDAMDSYDPGQIVCEV